MIYKQDFEDGKGGDEWVNGIVDSSSKEFTTFLGRYWRDNSQTSKVFAIDDTDVESILVTFSFYEFDSWDGNDPRWGKDTLKISIDGDLSETIENFYFGGRNDTYATCCKDQQCAEGIQYSSDFVSNGLHLGFNTIRGDQKHLLTVEIPQKYFADTGKLKLTLTVSLTHASINDESAGFDNFEVTTCKPYKEPSAQPSAPPSLSISPSSRPSFSPSQAPSTCKIPGSWQQKGSDIDGKADGDRFGINLSINSEGSRLVSAQQAAFTHLAYEFSSGDAQWKEIWSKDTEKRTAAWSPAMNGGGSIIVIGDGLHSVGSKTRAGMLSVHRIGGGQIGNKLFGSTAEERLGWWTDVSDDGRTILAGAPQATPSDSDRGYMAVYTLSSDDATWNRVHTVKGTASKGGFGLGVTVAMSGDGSTVAGMQSDAIDQKGSILVHHNFGGVWLQMGQEIFGDARGDIFGFTLDLSADGTMLTSTNNASKNTKVYKYDPASKLWVQFGSAIQEHALASAISADGLTLATTSTKDGNSISVFQFICGDWKLKGSIISGEETSGAQHRNSVELSDDGSVVAIGNWQNDGAGNDTGHVRVFEFKST